MGSMVYFLIMGNAGFTSSTRKCPPYQHIGPFGGRAPLRSFKNLLYGSLEGVRLRFITESLGLGWLAGLGFRV